jgi:hypothetical protein
MNISGVIAVVVIFIGLLLLFKISNSFENEDMDKLMNLLKRETKVLLPIGILMLGYQIYKSGHWRPSPETYTYITIYFHFINVFTMLAYKLFKNNIGNKDKIIFAVVGLLIVTPLITIMFCKLNKK